VDAGAGNDNWLIFRTGPSELGVHPTGPMHDGSTALRHHAISFVVDDRRPPHPTRHDSADRG